MNTPEPENYVYVQEPAVMAALIERIGAAERVALDTEADSLHNYFEKRCQEPFVISSHGRLRGNFSIVPGNLAGRSCNDGRGHEAWLYVIEIWNFSKGLDI